MKVIRWVSLFIYNIAATLGLLLFAGFVAGTVLLSYRFVETVAQQKAGADSSSSFSTQFKLAEVARLLVLVSQKTEGFDEIDKIFQQVTSPATPPICKILCAETNFHFTEEEPSTESNPILHLTKYYQQVGASALSDPKFRLSLETAALYSSLISRLAQAAWGMAHQVDDLQARASRISDLNLLRDSCGQAKPSGIAVECEALK